MRTILASLADTHGGCKLGLMSPNTILHDEAPDGTLVSYTPQLTAAQSYLYNLYRLCIAKTIEIANGDDIVLIHAGDICHGNKHASELVTTRLSDQITIAIFNLAQWLKYDNVKIVRIVAGTDAHEFGESSAAILVASALANMKKDRDIKTVSHGLMYIHGKAVDYSHHGPSSGRRVWLEGNEARYYLRDIMMREIKNKREPPILVLRAHYHTYVKEKLSLLSGNKEYESTLVSLPSMCLIDIYARKATKSAYSVTNGIVVFEIIDGELTKVHRLTYTIDTRTKEKL